MNSPTSTAVATGQNFDGHLERSFAEQLPELVLQWQAATAPDPKLVLFNESLAGDLGLDADALRSPDGVATLAGNRVPEGAKPVAMGYAGHQFGNFSPRLGDGRALLLGELVTADGQHHDIHLKGSGRTPFARGGDGKAELGPMLREYLIAEAMHALGIPTGRALAVVTTGEQVLRQMGGAPGGILTRVADSHIRVGTFEYAIRLEDGPDVVRRLADHAMARHYPDLDAGDYLGFLAAVVDTQAALIARWMMVGFIHGVMNTDNMTISGETIDYGPCAFMDNFNRAAVFSSIDVQGRYSFGNQPGIAQWDLTRLAETLLPLLIPNYGSQDEAIAAVTAVLEAYSEQFSQYWKAGMRAKLGLVEDVDTDQALFDDLLEATETNNADYTVTFRLLSDRLRGELVEPWLLEWVERWLARLDTEARPRTAVADEMDAVNPVYIPRNHLVDEALNQATEGDLSAVEELLAHVLDPYTPREGSERYAQGASDEFNRAFQTYCGT